ncbi:MFS general substrate transporter [Truncatella angustata]|uniref:MFS general substrate transporter n=1 Tax=Truncatella angustata TaxID=152316 RepID=A0A9P8ULQ8_9PEZI|nr:MFS general substrate transporter [Truncatella angustata]KAH6654428.1 MFS general substrate transporter [Truncatella angustata]
MASTNSTGEHAPAHENGKRRGILKQSKSMIGEQTPLLGSATREHEDASAQGPTEDDAQAHKSLWWILLLTVSIGGLQIAWSVELSNGSPYLLSLGMSKSLMALVWIAGPLSGTLVQPYVGMLSDNCRVSWGRRKPFMVGGAIATSISLMCLAWTKEMVGGLLELLGADPESRAVKVTILVVAVLWVYILDFAINTVQAAIRAFIVDCAPVHQQEQANAMASRIVGVGNIVGYLAGYVDLPRYAWWLGDTQFKVLCAIASIALCGLVLLSVLTVHERDPNLDGPPPKGQPGAFAFFRTILTSIKRLPPQVSKVCTVQFCAWIGFFPMLFYTSSFISEIYIEPHLEKNPHLSPEELDQLYEEGTRVGTFALLIFAVTSLATNVFLPFFVAPTYDGPVTHTAPGEAPGSLPSDDDKKSWLEYLIIPGFTLRRAWMLSNVIFAIAMFCAVFVRTVEAATALIGLVGITWALTLWAPWAIISAEISRRDAMIRTRRGSQLPRPQLADSDDTTEHLLGQEHSLHDEEETDAAGVILGIHNMAIASPQILATVGSSIIFRIFQKPRGTPGDHSIGIVFALGGVFVLLSCIFIARIKDEVPATETVAAEEGQAARLRPGMLRRKSTAQGALKRAGLVRSKSYGAGLEY